MKLVSMKLPKSKTEEVGMPSPMKDNPYPYGLRISLDDAQIKKLGFDDFESGEYVKLTANCCVKSVNENDENGKKTRRVELQIEDMGLSEGDMPDDEAEAKYKEIVKSVS